MALVKVNYKTIQNKSVLITNKDQVLDLADNIAPGLKDAILEFFVSRDELDPELTKQLDDYEGPDQDNIAGMDNEFFEDKDEI